MAQTFVGWNGIKDRPALFGATVLSSAPITIPLYAQSMTVHMPQLKAATSYQIDSLVPLQASDQTAVWNVINWLPDGSATPLTLSSLGSTSAPQTLVLKDTQFGSGVIRITLSGAQDADIQVNVFFELMD